jgi:hypothetical protein
MSLLTSLKVKDFRRQELLLIYGRIGCGKTSIAAAFSNSCFIVTPTERGIDQVKARGEVPEDYPVFMVNNWKEFRNLLAEMIKADKTTFPYETIVFDSLSTIQELVFSHVCETAYGNDRKKFNYFSNGQRDCEGPWQEFLQDVEKLRDKGIRIVLVAHATARTIDDPVHGSYTMWQPDIYDSEKQGSLLKPTIKGVTDMGFIEFAVHVDEEGKASGGVKRIVHFQRSASWEAKNQRNLKDSIPLGEEGPRKALEKMMSGLKGNK